MSSVNRDVRPGLVAVATALRERGLPDLADQVDAALLGLSESATLDRLLLAAINSLSEGLAVVDPEGRILFVNGEGQRLVGKVEYEAGPQEWSGAFGLYRPDGIALLPAEENPMVAALQEGRTVRDVEMLVRNPHLPPEGVLLSVSAAPVYFEGEHLGAVDIFRDVTELRRAQSDLAAALVELTEVDVARRDFVAVASHELRSPIATTISVMDTLLRGWGQIDDAMKLQFVRQVQELSHRVLAMVDDLLTTSKLDLGVAEVSARKVALSDLIEHVTASLISQEVAVRGDRGLTVLVDPRHLERIVTNFLTNALKYGAPPYAVTVEVEGRQALIKVSDAGPGVPPAFEPKLFSRFSRAGGLGASGSGLGLAIVRGLAQANGGDAWHERVTPHGACFVVSVPLSD